MKRITITVEDTIAYQLMSLFADKVIVSLNMESVDDPKRRHRIQSDGQHHRIIGQSLYTVISDHMKIGDMIKRSTVEDILTAAGYKSAGASASLSRLVSNGFFERQSDGRWKKLKEIPAGYIFQSKK